MDVLCVSYMYVLALHSDLQRSFLFRRFLCGFLLHGRGIPEFERDDAHGPHDASRASASHRLEALQDCTLVNGDNFYEKILRRETCAPCVRDSRIPEL